MSTVTEQAVWAENINLIAEDDPVQGGENGIDNILHQQLANRTAFLKKKVEAVEKTVGNIIVPADNSQTIKALQDGLAAETKTRADADTALQLQIDAISVPVDQSQAIKNLQDGLAAEIQNRTDGDKAIMGQLTEAVTLASLLERLKAIEGVNVPADSSQVLIDLQKALNAEIKSRSDGDTNLQNQLDAINSQAAVAGATITVIFDQYDKYVGNGREAVNHNNVLITGLEASQLSYSKEVFREFVTGYYTGADSFVFDLPDIITSEDQLIINSYRASCTVDMTNRKIIINPFVETYSSGADNDGGFWAVGNVSITFI